MRGDYALQYLQKLFQWDEEMLTKEAHWLRRMADFKYDGYQDFFGGERFISALIRWLCQFKKNDRERAYSLIRDHLIFLSAGEIQHLIKRTVPAYFHPLWVTKIAKRLGIEAYEVGASEQSVAAYNHLVRRSLFIGLSDGARMDSFRRSNVGLISNEQFALTYDLSESKLKSMGKELRKDEGDEARFEMVFLIDDFLGSGTTLCRRRNGEWKGKIQKFGDVLLRNKETATDCLCDDFEIVVHHYIAMDNGLDKALENLRQFSEGTDNSFLLRKEINATADLILEAGRGFKAGFDAGMDEFLKRYYDPTIMTKSLGEGGCEVHNGFADCGLVLVLEHNTPNNSLAILWAESSESQSKHEMRSLFRRRQRHN